MVLIDIYDDTTELIPVVEQNNNNRAKVHGTRCFGFPTNLTPWHIEYKNLPVEWVRYSLDYRRKKKAQNLVLIKKKKTNKQVQRRSE